MSTARTWFTARRKQIIIALLLLLAFVAALLLWAGRGGDDSALPPPPSTTNTPVDPSGSSAPSGANPSATSTAGGLPALPGFGNANLPDGTNLTTLGPGEHRVVITARSNTAMLAVAYSVRGDKQGKVFYNVKSPVVISRTLTGGRPVAAVVLQVSNLGTSGTCSISIDGKVVDTRSANKPYAVIGCSA